MAPPRGGTSEEQFQADVDDVRGRFEIHVQSIAVLVSDIERLETRLVTEALAQTSSCPEPGGETFLHFVAQRHEDLEIDDCIK